MNLRKLTTVAVAALVAATAATAALAAPEASTQAAPKPGFLPGTWIGKGTIKGSVVDGPIATHFDGGIAFTLKVSKKLAVSGTGTWQMTMLGSQDAPSSYGVDSTLRGKAAIKLAGPATNVAFSGIQHITGEFRSAGQSRPVAMPDRPLAGRLVITRAGKCKVVGTSPIQKGVTLTWSAKLKGSGTCNA